jgi:hypothetical protein
MRGIEFKEWTRALVALERLDELASKIKTCIEKYAT